MDFNLDIDDQTRDMLKQMLRGMLQMIPENMRHVVMQEVARLAGELAIEMEAQAQ